MIFVSSLKSIGGEKLSKIWLTKRNRQQKFEETHH